MPKKCPAFLTGAWWSGVDREGLQGAQVDLDELLPLRRTDTDGDPVDGQPAKQRVGEVDADG